MSRGAAVHPLDGAVWVPRWWQGSTWRWAGFDHSRSSERFLDGGLLPVRLILVADSSGKPIVYGCGGKVCTRHARVCARPRNVYTPAGIVVPAQRAILMVEPSVDPVVSRGVSPATWLVQPAIARTKALRCAAASSQQTGSPRRCASKVDDCFLAQRDFEAGDIVGRHVGSSHEQFERGRALQHVGAGVVSLSV